VKRLLLLDLTSRSLNLETSIEYVILG
jgi:hypothetical protein